MNTGRLIAIILCLGCSLPLAFAQRGLSPEVQSELQALRKREPTVQEAQRAALSFFNIDARSVQAMRSRASVKGLMPQVEARYRQNRSNLGVDTRNTTIQDDPFLFDAVDGTVHEFQVGLRFNLPSLVFNSEVLDVGSLAILQEGVLKEVTRLYYTRRRLQIDLLLNPPRDAATLMSKQLRIDELTSTLDAMTGELFTRAARRYERRSPQIRGDERDDGDVFRPLTPRR
ncbi:MAG: hypothetical protein VYA30_02665 [Myxococcota bacterium]|nr:hypothetical protein [Myxococcota bacterium]